MLSFHSWPTVVLFIYRRNQMLTLLWALRALVAFKARPAPSSGVRRFPEGGVHVTLFSMSQAKTGDSPMAKLQFANFGVAPQTAPAPTPDRNDRPKAESWLNIGITLSMPNPTTGDVEEVFVSLPLGLPVDTMEQTEMRGNNPRWAEMVQAKNALLKELQQIAENVVPGDTLTLEGLEIQIRRVGDAPKPAEGDNPLLAAMMGRLSVVK